MKIIAIASQKGGVGKSSTCAALNAGLRRKDKNVLCVDADAQGNLSQMFGAGTTGTGTTYDLLTGHSLRNCIQETPQGPIVAASASLADKRILQGKNAEYRFKDALTPFSASFDACIIDCGPTLGTVTHAALVAADGVVIPCRADRFSLEALRQIAATLEEVKSINRRLTVYGIVITAYDKRLTVARLMREQLEKQAAALDIYVYPTAVRKCVAVEEAQITGTSIFDAGRNNAADDYSAIVDELIQQAGL